MKPSVVHGTVSFGVLAACFSETVWRSIQYLCAHALECSTSMNARISAADHCASNEGASALEANPVGASLKNLLLKPCCDSLRIIACRNAQPILLVLSTILDFISEKDTPAVAEALHATWAILLEGWTEVNSVFKYV